MKRPDIEVMRDGKDTYLVYTVSERLGRVLGGSRMALSCSWLTYLEFRLRGAKKVEL